MTNASYSPGDARLENARYPRCLLVGAVRAPAEAEEVRREAETKIFLEIPDGFYEFDETGDGKPACLLVGVGESARSPASVRLRDIGDGDFIARALKRFNACWPGATPVNTSPVLGPGTQVRLRSDLKIGTVVSSELVNGSVRYVVAVDSDRLRMWAHDFEVFADDDDPHSWLEHSPAGASTLARTVTAVKLMDPLSDVMYAYGSSRTVFRAYQFRPAVRLLQNFRQRLLIADEVGLGKTIEAGLIWTELDHRTPIRRALVVCPAALVKKWQGEMEHRFGRRLELATRDHFARLKGLVAKGDDESPWFGVGSLEGLRLRALEIEEVGARFDLVIVDEAHYLRNAATQAFGLGEVLNDMADYMVLMSATPINLKSQDLFNLMSLLSPDAYPDASTFDRQLEPNGVLNEAIRHLRQPNSSIADAVSFLGRLEDLEFGRSVLRHPYVHMVQALSEGGVTAAKRAQASRMLGELNSLKSILNRTRRADVAASKAVREARTVSVPWNTQESRFYEAWSSFVRDKAKSKGVPEGFALQMPLRQAASSLPVVARRLLAGNELIEIADDDLDDLANEAGDTAKDDELWWTDRSSLRSLAMAVLSTDTKLDELRKILEELKRAGSKQVMVFSFFRGTIAYLAEHLTGYRVKYMHGGVPMIERERIMREFREGVFDILLLSEVGAEGLDFEFCNAVINYDIPWNPMRIEQRIGRVDRFGQNAEKIFVVNLVQPGTIEERIFQRLYERIDIFQSAIGDLEPILGEQLNDLVRLALQSSRSQAQQESEFERIAQQIEKQRLDLQQLQEESAGMRALDDALVEGWDAWHKSGKFVAQNETLRLVKYFVETVHHSSLKERSRQPGLWELHGDASLASALRSLPKRGVSSHPDLIRRIADGVPTTVTFDADTASRASVDLVGIQHPLVLAAVDYERATRSVRHARLSFVELSVEGELPLGNFLGLMSSVNVSGARPSKELQLSFLDLKTHELVDGLESRLSIALAEGAVRDCKPFAIDGQDLGRLVDLDQRRLDDMRELRSAVNDADVAARKQAVNSVIDAKLDRARSLKIDNMRRGRISNLELDREKKLRDLEGTSNLAVHSIPLVLVGLRTISESTT